MRQIVSRQLSSGASRELSVSSPTRMSESTATACEVANGGGGGGGGARNLTNMRRGD